MAVRKAVSAATWAKAKRQYADTSVALSDVADLVGLEAIQLSLEAKRRGWPPRMPARTAKRKPSRPGTPRRVATDKSSAADAAQVGTAAAAPDAASADAKNKKKTPQSLLHRVYATIDLELGKLENHKGTSSQDRERASRALSQMVNSLEKAIDMQREMSKRTPRGGSAKDKQELAHAEDLRRAIADRLARLSAKRDVGKRSRASD